MIMGNNDQSLVTRPGPELGKDQSIGFKASVNGLARVQGQG